MDEHSVLETRGIIKEYRNRLKNAPTQAKPFARNTKIGKTKVKIINGLRPDIQLRHVLLTAILVTSAALPSG